MQKIKDMLDAQITACVLLRAYNRHRAKCFITPAAPRCQHHRSAGKDAHGTIRAYRYRLKPERNIQHSKRVKLTQRIRRKRALQRVKLVRYQREREARHGCAVIHHTAQSHRRAAFLSRAAHAVIGTSRIRVHDPRAVGMLHKPAVPGALQFIQRVSRRAQDDHAQRIPRIEFFAHIPVCRSLALAQMLV